MRTLFISIIIPAYKEAERIGTTLLSLDDYFKSKKYSYEIIVVNDGSPDNLVEVVRSYAPRVKNLRVINNEINYGKGYAVRCGMIEARGRYRLFMDADNSVSISNLDLFMDEIAKGSEVVIGSIQIGAEKKNEHNGLHRRLLSRLSKAPVRMFATPGIYDTQRGFKLFTKKAAKIIFPRQTINRFAFDIELLVIAMANKLHIKEMPVAFDNPTGSTVRLSSYVRSLGDLFRISIKKLTGVYNVSSSGLVIHTSAGRAVVGAVVGIFLIITLFIGGSLLKTGIGIQANAAESPQTQTVTISPSSKLHVETATNIDPVSWIYSRKPMTKSDTGQLLVFAAFLMLFGADLVSGILSPRLYYFARKAFSIPILRPSSFAYRHANRNMRSRLIPHVVT